MKSNLFLKSPEEIIEDVSSLKEKSIVTIQEIDFILLPGVYPSHCFRATDFLLKGYQAIADIIRSEAQSRHQRSCKGCVIL